MLRRWRRAAIFEQIGWSNVSQGKANQQEKVEILLKLTDSGFYEVFILSFFPIDLDISQTLLHISLQKQITDTPAYVPRHPHRPWHSAWWDPCSSYGWTKSPVKRNQVWQQVVGSIEVDKSLPIHLSRRVVDYCQFGRDYITYYPPGDVVFLRGMLNLQWYWWKHEIAHH